MTHEITITIRASVPDEHKFLDMKAIADDVAGRCFVQLEGLHDDHGVPYENAKLTTSVVWILPEQPSNPLAWPFFEIPDWLWEPNGDDDDPTNRLNAACHFNNIPLHIEARAVTERDEGGDFGTITLQEFVGEYAEDYELLLGLAGEGGRAFYTAYVARFDRRYVVFAYPFYD